MKKIGIALIAWLYISQAYAQNLQVGTGLSHTGNLSISAGIGIDINSVQITTEYISMIPHIDNSTYFGARAGVQVLGLIPEVGYYYKLYSTDKNEYTNGKNYWVPAVFIRKEFGIFAIQAGYLDQFHIRLIVKLKL